MNIGEAATRKLGPLPAWGWGVALGGAYLVYKFVRGGSSTPQVVQVTGSQPGGSMDAGSAGSSDDLTAIEGQIAGQQGQLNTLTQALSGLLAKVNSTPTPAPSGTGTGTGVTGSPGGTTGTTTAGTTLETWQQAYRRLFGVPYGTVIPQTNLNNYAAHHRTGNETWQQAYKRIFGVAYGQKIPQANLNTYAAHHRTTV